MLLLQDRQYISIELHDLLVVLSIMQVVHKERRFSHPCVLPHSNKPCLASANSYRPLFAFAGPAQIFCQPFQSLSGSADLRPMLSPSQRQLTMRSALGTAARPSLQRKLQQEQPLGQLQTTVHTIPTSASVQSHGHQHHEQPYSSLSDDNTIPVEGRTLLSTSASLAAFPREV
jgi:hypothetical protein